MIARNRKGVSWREVVERIMGRHDQNVLFMYGIVKE